MVRISGSCFANFKIVYVLGTGKLKLLKNYHFYYQIVRFVKIDDNDTHSVQVIASGPAFTDDLICTVSCNSDLRSKRKYCYHFTFILCLATILLKALRIAAFRGVDITLILPKNNDSLMVRWASRTFFDDLLEAGVKFIILKQALHTKSVLIDNKLALVGTVNMDLRSFLL